MEGFQDVKYFIKSLYAAIKKKIPTKVSQLTNDAGYKTTDTNTTYKLSKSGSTVTLTGSDGSTTSVTDSNTTYSSLKNPYSLTVQNNGTTVESYDGSTAKTVNLTNATASSAGLMSAGDKKAIDREFFRMLPKGGTHIPANADLNSLEYIRVGNYYNSLVVESKTIKNIPLASAFMMYVLSPLSPNYDNESTDIWVYRLRIFIAYTGNDILVQKVASGATAGSFTYGPWVKMTNSNDLGAVSKIINDHIANKSNPHAVTKAQVGLGSVANLDQSKAIKSITRNGTTFTATALDGTKTTFTQQDTNTTYPVATTSTDGLMSKTDKAKLDGIASSPSMLTNLGSTAAANVFQASPRPGVTGVLPIANGGTGASSLEGLRSNLDIETTLDTTCNILVDNWVQDKTSLLYSNAVSVAGFKEGYVYDIDAYKGNLTTSAEVEAYNNDFSCISGGYAEAEEGKITFTVIDKPVANITVRVKGTQVITTEETQSTEINNQKSTITDLQSKFAKITDKIYPVGSIYISANSTSPAELFGGTWEQIKDRFLLAAGDAYAAGSTGGEAQHTLTVDEMPEHRHLPYIDGNTSSDGFRLFMGSDDWSNGKVGTSQFRVTGNHSTRYKGFEANTNTVGGSKPHNNMPPYFTVYMWQRTA